MGARCEIAALRAGHRPFAAEITLSRVQVPGEALYAVSIRDITKWRDRELRLHEAEAKYRTLVEQLPLVTYVSDPTLPVRLRYVSPQIETLTGFAPSAWLEPGFLVSRVHPDDRERAARARATSEPFAEEYRLLAADGSTVWVLDEMVAVRDAEYRPLVLQGFLLDVTARRAAGSGPQPVATYTSAA